MTDLHYFTKPTEASSGTFNPVFELLDHPVAMGDADDIVLTGPAPEKPVLDGREVTDPRLIRALSTPVELSRAEALDRSAKLAGILRAMDVVDAEVDDDTEAQRSRLLIDEQVPPLARALSIVAALRVGLLVDVRSAHHSGPASDAVVPTEAGAAVAEVVSEAGTVGARPIETSPLVLIHPIDAAPVTSGRASVKVVRSRFEGVGITVAGETANLDQAMRDSRVEPAEVRPLAPETTVILSDSGAIDAVSSLDWLRREVLTGRSSI